MRVLNNFSVAFYVIDALTKRAITNAIITHDGKHGGYVYRPDGYYVFKNMARKDYKFEIQVKGYQTRTFDISLVDNENLDFTIKADDPKDPELLIVEDPGVVLCLMNYSSQKRSLVPQPYAIVKKSGKALSNEWISVVMESKITDMRVARTVNEDCKEVSTNGDFFAKYMHQEYVCTSESKPLKIIDYNFEKNCYILQNPVSKKLKVGTLLKPMWRLKTDENGKVFLPVSVDFFYDKSIDFSVKDGKSAKKIKVDPGNGKTPYEVDF